MVVTFRCGKQSGPSYNQLIRLGLLLETNEDHNHSGHLQVGKQSGPSYNPTNQARTTIRKLMKTIVIVVIYKAENIQDRAIIY